jgi:O-methyltransferase
MRAAQIESTLTPRLDGIMWAVMAVREIIQMNFHAPVRILKATVRPLRRAVGRILIAPDQDLLRLRALRDHLFYKVGALIAGGGIKGDYLEFGVYSGNSFTLAHEAIRQAFVDMATPNMWNSEQDCVRRQEHWDAIKFVAFDSFEGLPDIAGDDAYTGVFTTGGLKCSESQFRQNVRRAGLPDSKVVIVPGFFDRTLNQDTIVRCRLDAAAIVHIDCDLYESARLVLDFVTPLLVDGSVLIFDDWFQFRCRPDMGERRALVEWSRAHGEITLTEYHKSGPWANSFIVNTRSPQW